MFLNNIINFNPSISFIIILLSFFHFRNIIIYIINIFIFTIFYIKTIDIDYIVKNSNILNYSFNKIALVWSSTENTFIIYIISINLLIILYYYCINNVNIFKIYLRDTYNVFKIITVLLVVTFNVYEYYIQYNFSYLTFNVILDNTYLIFHPPIILFSLLFFKYQIIIELKRKKIFIIEQNINNMYLFIYSILLIGIITGSLWSSYLFGWGGWWVWDPIENISITYLFVLIILFHINKNIPLYFEILKITLFYDYLFFFLFKLNYISSLHIFKSNVFYIKYNLFIYIIIFYLLLIFILSNNNNKQIFNNIVNNIFNYTLLIILLTFFLQNFNFIYLLNINYKIINIFLNYIMLLCVLEIIVLSTSYNNINIYINLIIALINIFFFTNMFLFLYFCLLILIRINKQKYIYFIYIHCNIFLILLLIIYYPIYEFNTYTNLFQSIVNYFKIDLVIIDSLQNQHISVTKSNKLLRSILYDNIHIYSHESLNIDYINNITLSNNNNHRNEFFLSWGNWYTKLIQTLFISFKVQNITSYFIVYFSLLILICNYLIYQKIYKKNNKIFYNYLIY